MFKSEYVVISHGKCKVTRLKKLRRVSNSIGIAI